MTGRLSCLSLLPRSFWKRTLTRSFDTSFGEFFDAYWESSLGVHPMSNVTNVTPAGLLQGGVELPLNHEAATWSET